MLYFGGDDYHPLQHTSYQDMNLAEIAKVLGVAPSNVSMRLKKGRELLRRALEGRNPD